jgi:hypothetical protein
MGEKRFTVFLNDGTVQTVVAESVSHKDLQSPISFLNSRGEVVATFTRATIITWKEEHRPVDDRG